MTRIRSFRHHWACSQMNPSCLHRARWVKNSLWTIVKSQISSTPYFWGTPVAAYHKAIRIRQNLLAIQNSLSHGPVIRVKGIGKKAEGLLKRNGIKTVANLRALTKETRPEGLTAKALKQFFTNCEDALSKNAPSITYYTEADNPFAARYGEEEDDWGQPEWISKIKSSTVFKHQVCVTDLVKHIVKQKSAIRIQNTVTLTCFIMMHCLSWPQTNVLSGWSNKRFLVRRQSFTTGGSSQS